MRIQTNSGGGFCSEFAENGEICIVILSGLESSISIY